MKWILSKISGFAASPFSGYLLIGILVALAGAGYWFWTELKEFGGLEQKAEAQADRIESQRQQLTRLNESIQRKQAAISEQVSRTQQLEVRADEIRQRINQSRRASSDDLRRCLSMPVPDGMRFGPASQDGDDQARSDVDG